MFDPKFANAFIGVGEGEAVGGEGMGEAGGIEIEAEAVFLCPRDPVGKMFRLDFIAIHFFAAEFAVEGVKVQAVLAGDQRVGLLQVGAQLLGRAGFAGIIAGGNEAAGQHTAGMFKTADVVALPAVEGDRYLGQDFQGAVNIHAEFRIAFPGQRKGLFNFIVHGEPRLENVMVNILRVCLKKKSPGFFGGATANSAPPTGLIPHHS